MQFLSAHEGRDQYPLTLNIQLHYPRYQLRMHLKTTPPNWLIFDYQRLLTARKDLAQFAHKKGYS